MVVPWMCAGKEAEDGSPVVVDARREEEGSQAVRYCSGTVQRLGRGQAEES